MLGLDTWNGSRAQVEDYRRNGGITFPMLLRASSGVSFSYENLVVIAPDGTVALSPTGGLGSGALTRAEGVVDELLAKIPSPVPAIAVQERAINFGTIDEGQTGEQTIQVSNTGGASLEVTGIESDVSGLTFEPSAFTLEPNGSQTVTVRFPSSTVGEFLGRIDILSNDPERAKHTLLVSVIVQTPPVPVLAVQETAVHFGTLDAGQTGQQTIRVSNTGTASLEVTGIESDVSGLIFEPSAFTIAPNDSQTVTVRFPSSTVGEFLGRIDILSNDPERARHTLLMSVIVQPAPVPVLAVQETAVNFGTVEVMQSVQRTIRVSNTGTASLEVTGIESDVSGLTFEPSAFTLAPNDSQTVTVRFPSSTVGEFLGRINILSNDPERARHTLLMSVTVQPRPIPVLAVQETAIHFGTIELAQMVQQMIRVSNTGIVPLEVTGIESDVSGLTFEPSVFTVAPNGSQMVTVRFPSSTVGEFSGSIDILSNDPERARHTIAVSVVVRAAPVPVLSVQETAVHFGTVEVAQAVQQMIRVSNTGTVPLEVTGIESDVSGLTFEPSVFTLEPNGSQMVTVRFPSSTVGEFSGSIDILSNDPERARHTIAVSIIVRAAPVPAIGVQEMAVNFGTVEVAQSVQQTIRVSNTGTVPLEVTGIESDVSGLTFEPSVFTVAPNDSQMVTVRFPSSTVGEFSGSINILSNDPERARHTIAVSVVVRAAPVPVLGVQEMAVNFGTVEVAQSVQQTIRVVNTGTASLEVTGIESDVSGLTFEPSAFTVAPNDSQTVTIRFPSSTVGEFSGSISILSNDPERAKHTIAVSVVVRAAPVPAIGVQETAVHFGTVEVAQSVQQTIRVVNTGTASLEVTGIESDVSGLTFEPSVFTLEPNGSQMVTITLPNPMEGEFSGSINILSNDPERAKHTLSVSVIVQPLSVEAKSDFDGNGVIEFPDFLLFVGAFGSSESQYDIDGNGVVDFPDFLLFVQVFGKTVDG